MSKNAPPLIPALLLWLAVLPAGATGQLPGQVLRVIDGDTLVLQVQGGQQHVDLSAMDAPELNQPWGRAAADYLHRLLTGRFVIVAVTARDRQGTRGSIVFKRRDIALEMLREGLAWSTSRPTEQASPGAAQRPDRYLEAEQQARLARRGLWSDQDPTPPWEWRNPWRQ